MRYLRTFLRDEAGSASIWSLLWFLGFVALLGLAVDVTGAMNSKAKLQWVADASSHAGVIDIFPLPSESVPAAVQYAALNTDTARAVLAGDVEPGYWDDASRTFDTDSSSIPYYNAVRVEAVRHTSRTNELLTSFLRVVGLNSWDIRNIAIAVYSDDIDVVDRCYKNGLVAGNHLEQTANNTITGELCMHGEGSFKITQNNLITCGVEMSTSDPSGYQSGTAPTYKTDLGDCDTNYGDLTTYDMIDQSFVYRSLPSNAVAEYGIVKRVLDAYIANPGSSAFNDPLHLIPPYLVKDPAFVRQIGVNQFNNLAKVNGNNVIPGLVPGTLYRVTCTNKNQQIFLEGIVRNVGIYTNCLINVRKNRNVSLLKPTKTTTGTHAITACDPDFETCDGVDWKVELDPMKTCADAITAGFEKYQTLLDTAPGETYRDGVTTDTNAELCGIEPGANGLFDNVFIFTTANEDGNRSQESISFPNNMQIGRVDACSEGGGARIYLGGSMSTPSGTVIHGSHFVLLGSVWPMAAKANGVNGVTIDAAQDIKYSAKGQMAGCPASEEDRQSDVTLAVRPIAIVD